MATTTRSSNGRSKQAGTRRTGAANGSAGGRANRNSRTNANRSSGTSARRKIAPATTTVGSAAKKAKTPIVAGGAAAAGLATGTALGALLRGSRRPRALGVPLPRGGEVKAGAKKALRAGRWLYDMETDLRLLREHAENSRRQSPIEVLLSGLTSRRLPRGR